MNGFYFILSKFEVMFCSQLFLFNVINLSEKFFILIFHFFDSLFVEFGALSVALDLLKEFFVFIFEVWIESGFLLFFYLYFLIKLQLINLILHLFNFLICLILF